MTDHPILFSAPMIRALLEGRKTQTRRVLKPQPEGQYQGMLTDTNEAMFGETGIVRHCDLVKIKHRPGDRLWVVQFRVMEFGDGKYAVGDDGHVYDISGPEPKRRKPRLSHNGYEEITLRYQGAREAFRINRLVAEAFLGAPRPGEVCRHLNNVRRDNRPQNLDWGTPAQNAADAAAAGSFSGERASKSKLTSQQVKDIRDSKEPQQVLADRYGVTQPTISKIRNDKRWKVDRPPAPPRNRAITFSRLTLTVTDVRVQRLQDISTNDARAEGIDCDQEVYRKLVEANQGIAMLDRRTVNNIYHDTHVNAFADLWNSINGPDAWDANPWVTATSFTVHKCNIDQMEQASDYPT